MNSTIWWGSTFCDITLHRNHIQLLSDIHKHIAWFWKTKICYFRIYHGEVVTICFEKIDLFFYKISRWKLVIRGRFKSWSNYLVIILCVLLSSVHEEKVGRCRNSTFMCVLLLYIDDMVGSGRNHFQNVYNRLESRAIAPFFSTYNILKKEFF